MVTVTSSGMLIAHLGAVSGTGTCGACPYSQAGLVSGTGTCGACPYKRPASRRHSCLDNGMVGVLVDRCEETLQRRLAAEGAAALVDVRAELLAELGHVRGDR